MECGLFCGLCHLKNILQYESEHEEIANISISGSDLYGFVQPLWAIA